MKSLFKNMKNSVLASKRTWVQTGTIEELAFAVSIKDRDKTSPEKNHKILSTRILVGNKN